MIFWVFAKVYGMRERIVPRDLWFRSVGRPIRQAGGAAPGIAAGFEDRQDLFGVERRRAFGQVMGRTAEALGFAHQADGAG